MSSSDFQPEQSGNSEEALIKDCKRDACIDRFIVQVASLMESPSKGGKVQMPDFSEDSKLTSSKKFNEIKTQLFADLRRLIPDVDISLDLNNMKPQIEARWNRWQSQRFWPGCSDPPPNFHHALLGTILQQRYLEDLESGTGTEAGTKQGAPSLQQEVQNEACRQLKDAIEGEKSSASFACGGTIVVSDPIKEDAFDVCKTSAPVNIFWATKEDPHLPKRLVLPLKDTRESNPAVLQQLVADCAPAAFGKGSEDVLDPAYRRAGKLDVDQFASTFHPADFGILENVERILLPSVNTKTEDSLEFRKLTAELYKLNVYSGPSGHFKAHVDTPRSAQQIGSLVVCLPSSFKGGNLAVRHCNHEVNFDWSSASASTIQWAAFYSDCEHEITTITEGERITLTYNLYITDAVRDLVSGNPVVEVQKLPMYGYIRALMEQPGFMKEGGVLGVFCSHGYAQASNQKSMNLPAALKGSDLVMYSIFKSLGYAVDVLPVMEHGGDYHGRNPQLGITGKMPTNRRDRFYIYAWGYGEEDLGDMGDIMELTENEIPENEIPENESSDYPYTKARREQERRRRKQRRRREAQGPYLEKLHSLEDQYEELIENNFKHCDDVDLRWQTLLMGRQLLAQKIRQQDAKRIRIYDIARVGMQFLPYQTTDCGEEEPVDETAQRIWPFYFLSGITWLTEPKSKHEEMAFTQIVYGNEPSLGTRYTCAAIFIVIPPWPKRIELLDAGAV